MAGKTGFFSCDDKKCSWWLLGVKVGVVTALIVWMWLEKKNKEAMEALTSRTGSREDPSIPLPEEELSSAETPAAVTSSSDEAPGEDHPPKGPDDLTIIEGIGPKINATLQEAGISSFALLAAIAPQAIKTVLVEAGIRLGYPDTWPEQAALAANADWEGLEKFQSSLHGGRRKA